MAFFAPNKRGWVKSKLTSSDVLSSLREDFYLYAWPRRASVRSFTHNAHVRLLSTQSVSITTRRSGFSKLQQSDKCLWKIVLPSATQGASIKICDRVRPKLYVCIPFVYKRKQSQLELNLMRLHSWCENRAFFTSKWQLSQRARISAGKSERRGEECAFVWCLHTDSDFYAWSTHAHNNALSIY